MPFITGRFYMNPAYGRAVEGARGGVAKLEVLSNHSDQGQQSREIHWVTIGGRHAPIQETQKAPT